MTQATPYLTDPSGQKHLLAGERLTIGRAIESDIVVTGSRVSREHARLSRTGRQVLLEDLRSTNGSYLNDERVLGPVELRDGDRLSIGDVVFTFHDPDSTYRDDAAPDLEIDIEAQIVRVNRRVAQLTPKEFALLALALALGLLALYLRSIWLILPALVVGLIGATLQLSALTGWWSAWAVLWAVVPFGVGLSLLIVGLGRHSNGLRLAGMLVCLFTTVVAVSLGALLTAHWSLINMALALGLISAGTALALWGRPAAVSTERAGS